MSKIDPIHVDPALLPGFSDDFDRDWLTCDDAHDFPHDADWVAKTCESIKNHCIALIRMPVKYAALYQQLLLPETFPFEVKDMKLSGELKASRTMLDKDEVLSPDLQAKLKAWSTVCEHVTRHVAQRLRRLVHGYPLEPTSPHEAHGQLRVATNCCTEPHNDNSYVTILGTGSMRNTLKLQVEGREDPNDWMCAIDFVEHMCSTRSDLQTFLLYAGSKLCKLDDLEYKPMNHIVDFARENNIAPGTERINLTYFVRRYDEGYDDAPRDITSTEIQFQYWNRIIMQQELVHRPPRPPRVVRAADDPAFCYKSPEEEFLESGFLDWSTDGVPV